MARKKNPRGALPIPSSPSLSRRDLLGGGAALAGLSLAGPGAALAAAPAGKRGGRLDEAYEVRRRAAELARDLPVERSVANGDEEALPGRAACFSKGLPHNALGEVDEAAYGFLLKALAGKDPLAFEAIPLGGQVKIANPQAALAFNLMGPDPSQLPLPPTPRFASAEQGAELVELYWQALARDVPFADYETHPLMTRAAEDLSRLPGFQGPKEGGRVTPRLLFRGSSPGDLAGPYISQFLWQDVPFTPIRFQQKLRTAVPGLDYLTDWDGWLASQNGAIAGVNRFDTQARYIRNGRDLGEFVHRDFSYQAGLAASLMLLKMGAPPDGGNPYKHSRTQSGFATFGAPYLLYLLGVVSQVALAACWYQKWQVHRRLRPEELGGRVENQLLGRARYPLDEGLLGSAALAEVQRRTKTALLPQAYPEGSPTHPSYPAGHAVLSGAGVTVLKAFFDESFAYPNPVVPTRDGLALEPYKGPPLSIGDELDKLAANVGMGRDFAGIHWRSDLAAGLALGEAAAIAVLRELKLTGNEIFSGFSLRRFDGRRVTL